MRLPKLVCGFAVMGVLMSACGGGSSPSASASSSSSPPNSATSSSATLSWTAPTTNSNGTALEDLAGFHVHYGMSASSMTQEADVPTAGAVSYTVSGLAAGVWYFAVSDYTTDGTESPLSAVVSKTII
jgi:Fibronectin type III domain